MKSWVAALVSLPVAVMCTAAQPAAAPTGTPVTADGLVAALYLPAGAHGRLPGIIILGGGGWHGQARCPRRPADRAARLRRTAGGIFRCPWVTQGPGADSARILQDCHRLAACAAGCRSRSDWHRRRFDWWRGCVECRLALSGDKGDRGGHAV